MAGKKLGKEAFHRMNFLYQAAKICHKKDSIDSVKLSLYYGSHIKSIGHKAQCKMDPQLKRTLCKGCNTILTPGITASVKLCKKPDPVLVCICLLCGTYKVFKTRESYIIWAERSESLLNSSKNDDLSDNKDLNRKISELELKEALVSANNNETDGLAVLKES